MKNPFTKFTAAAMVFLAVILGVTFLPNSNGPMALAGVLETLKNAACVSYDIQIGKETNIRDTVMGNRIRREAMGAIVMIDLEEKRMMSLNAEEKMAINLSFDGLPKVMKNYLEHLIHILETLKEAKEGTFEELGQRRIEGQLLDGYLFKYQSTEAELWIDPETSLPSIITERSPGMEATLSHFDFSIEPDPALFEMTPPEGYTVINADGMIDFKKDATEESFIEGLRFMAGLRDGWFPRDVSVESFVENAEEIGWLVEKKYKGTFAQLQAGMSLAKGVIFLRFYNGQGPWHYAGNGVKLGQADKPIFWYQPKDSAVFHVIFGDLHVEEVTPENLDSAVSAADDNSKYNYQVWGNQKLTWMQDDLWRIKAGGVVEVTSTLHLCQGPAFIHRIPMTMPIDGGQLLSATLDEIGLPFEKKSQTEYLFFPDGEQLANGATSIELIWQFPLDKLSPTDYGYTVPLKSWVPVINYKISAGLEPDSGYIWSQTPEELEKSIQFSKKLDKNYADLAARFTGQPPLVLFTTNGKENSQFGTCGLAIKPQQ